MLRVLPWSHPLRGWLPIESSPQLGGLFLLPTSCATPLALETARQAEMQYGVCLSPTILATIRSTANGASGLDLGLSPYAPVLRNDKYLSGSNMACSFAVFSNAAFGTYGDGSYKLERDIDLAPKRGSAEIGTAVVYSPEHREMSKINHTFMKMSKIKCSFSKA